MSSTSAPVIIAAGGTGGHVYPALAVAQALRERDLPVIWLGTRKGLESRVVPEHGFEIRFIRVVGMRGKRLVYRLLAPLLLVWATLRVIVLILGRQPRCVLGMGGFVAAAAGFAAIACRRRLLIQEQNAIAGTTNRLLARFADQVFTGFPGVFEQLPAARFTGNPLRAGFYQLPTPRERRAERSGDALSIVVMGGSLGARALNETVPLALAQARAALTQAPRILHQSGEHDVEAVCARYVEHNLRAEVTPFVDDMVAALANADLVIARAGALTISELVAVGVAAVLVPYPHAIDDHQTENARWLAGVDAAIVVPQSALDAESLAAQLVALLTDRERLLQMADNARTLVNADAAVHIAQACRGGSDD